MMTEKEVILTYEGLQRLEEEFDYLKGSKRMEVAERIKQALSFGDISENSEYDDAKNDQAQMEIRIINLENMLKNAKVIDEDELSTETVALGTKVKLFDMDENVEITYMIVGSTETNPIKQKISNESPVGAALIGKRKGDIVKINVPSGFANYKILDILK
ncbi:MAG TPA: transcription elongation factor GreA [Clostridia bacterium]|nr:transcription elongation factor GreA [Clostridia bacterium]